MSVCLCVFVCVSVCVSVCVCVGLCVCWREGRGGETPPLNVFELVLVVLANIGEDVGLLSLPGLVHVHGVDALDFFVIKVKPPTAGSYRTRVVALNSKAPDMEQHLSRIVFQGRGGEDKNRA